MSRFDTFLASHATFRNRTFGQTVTYVRQSTSTELEVTARKAGVRTVDQSGGDVLIHTEWFDWVIASDDLTDDGSLFEPSEGDSIVVGDDTYTVGTYGDDKVWAPTDSGKGELVIHTKLWGES